MTKLKHTVPEKLLSLWKAEDELLGWSEEVLQSEEYLLDHLDLIESYLDCVDMMRKQPLKSERHTAIAGLFLRSFDSMSHCVRGALSGNYSGSAMYARDLIETQFLVSYLMQEEGRPEKWLGSDPDTARRDYSPVKVRKALDERDGFKKQKRQKHYAMLSALGSHPTPASLELKRDGTRAINAGPFKHSLMLKECIQEAAKATILLSGVLLDYCNEEVPNGRAIGSRLALVLQRTRMKYFDRQTEPGGATGGHT